MPIEQSRTFQDEAGVFLPGFLYSFNIADLKRRNSHLGFRRVDQDIEELNRMLNAMAGCVLVKRVTAARWLMVSRRNEDHRVQALLDGYRRTERITTGWMIEAIDSTAKKQRLAKRQTVLSEISRAVRCLRAEAETVAGLETAIREVAENDWNLPVNQVLPVAGIRAMAREPWLCVARYPAEVPSCPVCEGRDFDWRDGDSSIYSGNGKCRGCGADILITQIDEID